MGMLIQFSPKAPRSVPAPHRATQTSADVLLFTGIRYERGMGPQAQTRSPTGRRKRKG